MNFELSASETQYIERLARRYTQYRKSASIDYEDLVSVAKVRWWRYRVRNPESNDESILQMLFYQQVKGAMRDLVRDSYPVKVTRTMQAQLQAYQKPYTVSMESVYDVRAGDEERDVELWMDVLSALRKLTEREQIILSLYFEKGYSFTDIAFVFDVSVSTITRAYQKAIEFLKKEFGQSVNNAKKRSI